MPEQASGVERCIKQMINEEISWQETIYGRCGEARYKLAASIYRLRPIPQFSTTHCQFLAIPYNTMYSTGSVNSCLFADETCTHLWNNAPLDSMLSYSS